MRASLSHTIARAKQERKEMPAKVAPILVSLDTNEAYRKRAELIENAVERDDNFLLVAPRDQPFDLRFQWEGKTLDVEIKDFTGDDDHESDYVNSIVDPEGHLYLQSLAGRELQNPLAILVVGGDKDVATAIAKNVFTRGFRGQEAADLIIAYTNMVEGFEANCEGLKIRVWRHEANPYGRMLLKVRKMLQGGDLTGFRPSPADDERLNVGFATLVGNGVGVAKGESVLNRFKLTLVPKAPDCYLEDCEGIGPKLSEVIRQAFGLPPEVLRRPKVRKPGRQVVVKLRVKV